MAADRNVELVFRANTGRAAKDVQALGKDLSGIGSKAGAATTKAQKGFSRFSNEARKSGRSVDQLEKNIVQLRVDLEYLEQQRDKSFDPRQIRRYNAEIEDLNDTIRKQSALSDKPSKSPLGSAAGMVGRLAAGAGIAIAFQRGISRAIQKGSEFESKLADLEAITGITGERLDRLGQKSLDLSTKYGTAASDIVEANKLVASVLAEKIDFNTEEGFQQLQEISEQAVVLQKAAGLDLATAVNVTSSAINQFGLAASESNRVINTLAAGSKFGAAEVDGIGRALKTSGVAAAGANISLEATNAAIQVLASNAIMGERAGTALRAVFLRLQTSSQELADLGIEGVDIKANGLVATLRQLNPIVDDAAALKKIFGEEAFNAASALIREVDMVESLEEKVTGTNTAYKQAAVQMDTFDHATKVLSATIDTALIPAFTETAGITVEAITALSSWIGYVASAIREVNTWTDAQYETNRRITLTTAATNAQITSIQTLREELAKAWKAGDMTAAQQDSLKASFEASNEYIEAQATALYNRQAVLANDKKALEEQIKLLKERGTHERAMTRFYDDLQGINNELAKNAENLKGLEAEYKAGLVSLEEYTEGLQELENAEQVEKLREEFKLLAATPFLSDEQQAKLDELAAKIADLGGTVGDLLPEELELDEELKALQQQYTSLINQPTLDDAGVFKGTQILDRIQELEELLEKRERLIRSASGFDGTRPSAPPPIPTDDLIEDEIELPDFKIPPKYGEESISYLTQLRQEAEKSYTNAASDEARKRYLNEIEIYDREIRAKEAGISYVEQLKIDAAEAEKIRDQERVERVAQYVDATSQGITAIAGLFSAMSDHKVQKLENEKEQKLENINAELAQEGLSEQRRNQLLLKRQKTEERYQKKIDKIKRDQFEVERKANLAGIAMNTAVAVSKLWATTGPLAIFTQALAVGMGIAQAAIVATQPNPYEQGGWIGGRRHRDGGTIIEAEKDEFITNRRSAPEAARVLTYINKGPAAAREVEGIFDAWASGRLPVGKDGGFISPQPTQRRNTEMPADFSNQITSAIREGMAGVIVDAHVAIDRVDEELGRLQDFKKRIGN